MALAKTSTVFRKLALRPGVYAVSRNGRREEAELSPERLRKVIASTNRMLKKGIKVPVPYAHADENGVMPYPVVMSDNGAFIDAATGKPIGWRSDLNAGFLKSIDYGNLNGEEGVIVEVEVPGDADSEPDSPAAKFGKTIQETSLALRPDYSDSQNNHYGEAIVQVAAVVNPVEFNQQNFSVAMNETLLMASFPTAKAKSKAKPLSPAPRRAGAPKPAPLAGDPKGSPIDDLLDDDTLDDESADDEEGMEDTSAVDQIPLTDDNGDEVSEEQPQDVEMTDLVQALNEFGLSLPEDTNIGNLVERLRISVRQRLADQGQGMGPGAGTKDPQPPQGASTPNAPIAMSEASNPALSILLAQADRDRKADLRKRAERLVKCGRLSSAWVEKNLSPRIESLVMNEAMLTPDALKAYSETGKFPMSDVENVIAGLESAGPVDLTVRMSEGGVDRVTPEGESPANPLEASKDEASHKWYADERNNTDQGSDSLSDEKAYELAVNC